MVVYHLQLEPVVHKVESLRASILKATRCFQVTYTTIYNRLLFVVSIKTEPENRSLCSFLNSQEQSMISQTVPLFSGNATRLYHDQIRMSFCLFLSERISQPTFPHCNFTRHHEISYSRRSSLKISPQNSISGPFWHPLFLTRTYIQRVWHPLTKSYPQAWKIRG